MNETFYRNLRVLWRTETVIADIHMRHLTARLLWRAGAGLMATFGIAMLNVAMFLALSPRWASPAAAAAVALVDLLLAAAGLLVASRIRPGPDLDLAREVRDEALSFIETDARALGQDLAGLTMELRTMRKTIGGMVHNPLDNILPGVIVPLASALLKSLRKPAEPT